MRCIIKTALSFSVLVCVLFLACGSASGAVLLYEGFDYSLSNGASIAGANGGTGAWNGAWAAGPDDPAHVFTSTGLTYTNGGALPVSGGAIVDRSGDGDRHSRRLVVASTIDGLDETFWFSYLLQPNKSLYERVKFEAAAGPREVTSGFGTDNSLVNPDGQISAELSNSRGATMGVTDGNVIFVVGKIAFDAVGDGNLEMWFNIALTETEGTIGTADSEVAVASGSYTLGDYVHFRSGNNHEGVLDEIRLGESLADVIPEPATFFLAAVGLLGLRRRRQRA